MVYDGQTRQLRRTIARFKDKAYGATWREDGKLLVAGGQDGVVQVGAGPGAPGSGPSGGRFWGVK